VLSSGLCTPIQNTREHSVKSLLSISRSIDWCTERIGRSLYWLLLVAVIISTLNAIIRKAFDMSSNGYLEAQWYLFAAVFMLGSGYVFLHDQHVRIDVVAGKWKRKTQVWVDVVGIIAFLLPLCVFVIYTSIPSLMLAFNSKEVSANPGGLIRWPLYALVPIGFSLLAIQSVSELFKRLAFLTGHAPDPHEKPEKTDEQILLEELTKEVQKNDSSILSQGAPK
jgi:TRAP-type mannitol/chloroaromatic compound transport system permease small subunit